MIDDFNSERGRGGTSVRKKPPLLVRHYVQHSVQITTKNDPEAFLPHRKRHVSVVEDGAEKGDADTVAHGEVSQPAFHATVGKLLGIEPAPGELKGRWLRV